MMGSRLYSLLTGIACALLLSTTGQAQDDTAKNFPNKPIRIIVGYSAGGGNDIIARVVSAKMTLRTGHTLLLGRGWGA